MATYVVDPRVTSIPTTWWDSHRPLPLIVEEAPIRERTCDRCGIRYAVFGDHVACPVCGPHPPRTVATDAFDAQESVLFVVDHVPAEVLDQLR